MKKQMTALTIGSRFLCGLLLTVATMLGTASAQDINKIWTSVGSTGTVDDADTDKLRFNGPLVVTKLAAPGTKAVVRYNVVAVDGLFANLTPTSWPALIVRYNTLNGRGRVVARLKEYIMNGPQQGQTNTLITVDSDDFPQDVDFQTRSLGNCGNFSHFQFASPFIARSYFVEVEITSHTGVNGIGVGALAISRYGVCLNNVFQQP
ncbi:MAG: hypothetical protein ABIU20_09815 [Blastocatellia bacterium]